MADENLVQIGFEVDIDGLQSQLSESEQRAQAAVQRMGELQNKAGDDGGVVISSPPGAPPPAPPPQKPPPGAPGTPTEIPSSGAGGSAVPPRNQSAHERAQEELARIRSMSKESPDVALAALTGRGGLQSRVGKEAIADPENAQIWQELLQAVKEQTRVTKDQVKEGQSGGGGGGAPSQILQFMRRNVGMQVAGNVANQAMGGDLVGAGMGAIGGIAGFAMGGPVGAMAGQAIAATVSATINKVLGAASENRRYSEISADISARFGNISETNDALDVNQLAGMDRSGYSIQDTAGLFDQLRQSRVIDSVDEESKALVESLQALTRATGMNTDALVNQYSNYSNLGGEESAEGYMAQVIAGAIASGMESNLAEYSEMLGSARMQLVYRSGMGDNDDGALKAIQGTLAHLMGGESDTSNLLRDNPAMAQQLLGTFLQSGASQQYSYDSAAMQMAGVERGRTDAAYTDPEQQVNNAIARYEYVLNQFLGSGGVEALGFSNMGQLQEAAQQNPNLLQERISSQNPDAAQAAQLQDMLNMNFQGQFGHMPEAQNIQLLTQLGSTLLREGSISPDAVSADGDSTLAEMLEEANKTEGQRSRDAADAKHTEMMIVLERLAVLPVSLDEMAAELIRSLGDVISGIEVITGYLSKMVPGGRVARVVATSPVTSPIGALMQAITGNAPEGEDNSDDATSGPGLANVLGSPPPEQASSTTSGRSPRGGESRNRALSDDPSEGGAASINSGRGTRRQDAESSSSILQPTGSSTSARTGRSPARGSLQSSLSPDAIFGDTPPGGVMATENFNTFQFAPGDIIQASQSRNETNYQTGGPVAITINQTISVGGGDRDSVLQAARRGATEGMDEFAAQWGDRLGARNRPRINDRLY